MALSRTLLRPGLLVALHTEARGGITREKRDLDASDVVADGDVSVTRTETTTIMHADTKAAREVQAAARSKIARVCVPTKVGLLCPHSRVDELERAIAEANEMVREHNSRETVCKVALYAVPLEIGSSEEVVARAVASQMRDVLERMERAIGTLNPDEIRKAANEARKLSTSIAPEQAVAVQTAVDAARKAASNLVEQAAESARRMAEGAAPVALVLAEIQKSAQACARSAFLDFTDDAPAVAEGPAVAGVRVAGLDMTDDVAPPAPDSSGPALTTRAAVDLSADASPVGDGPRGPVNGTARAAGMWDLPLAEVAS